MSTATAAAIDAAVPVPTIGIGAGTATTGHVLVGQDMAGLRGEKMAKFVKQHAGLRTALAEAATYGLRRRRPVRTGSPARALLLAGLEPDSSCSIQPWGGDGSSIASWREPHDPADPVRRHGMCRQGILNRAYCSRFAGPLRRCQRHCPRSWWGGMGDHPGCRRSPRLPPHHFIHQHGSPRRRRQSEMEGSHRWRPKVPACTARINGSPSSVTESMSGFKENCIAKD